MSSYVLWANKGGIGKSTLSFQLACKYARQHEDKTVVIIDLSPQCDVSRMVLGGGQGDGESRILDVMRSSPRKTVYQYLRECVRDVPVGLGFPDAMDFLVSPNDIRVVGEFPLPDNLKLFCGDFDLERITQDIEGMPQPAKRGGLVPSGAQYSRFVLARSFLRVAIERIKEGLENVVVFIDTDPYYSVVTTHLGLLAADSLIMAYSPSSQASQYAIYRSLDFLHSPGISLSDDLSRENGLYPRPWFDQRDNPLDIPDVQVPRLGVLISNMTTSRSGVGEPRYSRPQQLHRQAISNVEGEVERTLTRLGQSTDIVSTYVWSLQRLGLICDFNGIDMSSVQTGRRYAQPDSEEPYRVDRSDDNQLQVTAYNERLEAVVRVL